MRRTGSILRLSAIGLLALDCGGATDSAPTPSSSGVEETTVLSAVGPTEAAAVCGWYYVMMLDSSYVQSLCQRFALSMARSSEADTSSDTAVQSGCKAAQTLCITKMQEDMVAKKQTCTATLDQATCSATVGDFEACARALAQLSFAGLPACNALTVDYEFPASAADPALPAECATLQSSCSEAMDGMRLGA